MGNIFTSDVATNAINGLTEAKNGSGVVGISKGGSYSASNDSSAKYTSIVALENKLTDKFDEVDYYEIPGALDGGGFTPTPSPTPTPTPTPSPTPV